MSLVTWEGRVPSRSWPMPFRKCQLGILLGAGGNGMRLCVRPQRGDVHAVAAQVKCSGARPRPLSCFFVGLRLRVLVVATNAPVIQSLEKARAAIVDFDLDGFADGQFLHTNHRPPGAFAVCKSEVSLGEDSIFSRRYTAQILLRSARRRRGRGSDRGGHGIDRKMTLQGSADADKNGTIYDIISTVFAGGRGSGSGSKAFRGYVSFFHRVSPLNDDVRKQLRRRRRPTSTDVTRLARLDLTSFKVASRLI